MILSKEENKKQIIINHLKKQSMIPIKKLIYLDKGQECHYR